MPGCLTKQGFKDGSQIYAEGVETATYIREAGAIAIAIANASQVLSNAKKAYDISSKTLGLSEELQDRQEKIFWPRELEFLREFGTPEEVEEAEAYGRRFAGRLVSSVASTYAKQIKKIKCNASRYCTSDYLRQMQGAQIAKAEAIANARVLGRQMGFAYRMARIDRNDQRRLQAIALSKDLFQHAANLYKNAVGGLAGSTNEVSADINRAIQAFFSAEEVSKSSAPLSRVPLAENYSHLPATNSANPSSVVTESVGKSVGFKADIANLYSMAGDMLGDSGAGGAVGFSGTGSTGLKMAQAENGLSVASGFGVPSTMSVLESDKGLTSIDSTQTVGKVSLTKVGPQTFTTEPAGTGKEEPRAHTHKVTINLDDFKNYAYTDALNSQKDWDTLEKP